MKKALSTLCVLMVMSSQLFAQIGLGNLKKLVKKEKEITLDELLHEDDSIISDTHEEFLGQITFANEALNSESISDQFISTYELGDPLFIAGYMPRSLANQGIKDHFDSEVVEEWNSTQVQVIDGYISMQFNFYLDDQFIMSYEAPHDFTSGRNKSERTTFFYALDNGASRTYDIEKAFEKLLIEAPLSAGSHQLRIEAEPFYNSGFNADPNLQINTLAVGSLTINVSEGRVPDESKCFPRAAMRDSNLENQLAESLNWKETEILKVIISAGDWTIVRNEISGVIIKKTLPAYVVFKKDGKLSYKYYTFYKAYDGATYGSIQVGGIGDTTTIQVECEAYLN